MRRVLISCAIAVAGVLASASVASAAPCSFISFGGSTVSAPVSTPATSGVSSTENPDKILAGDPSGFDIVRYGQTINYFGTVGQTVTTATQ
jgi:hypothetical protein